MIVGGKHALVGRTREVDEIIGLTRATKHTQALLITGPSGAGRTALLDEAARRCAAEDIGVSRLRLHPEDADTPYGLLYRLASDLDRTRPAAGTAARPGGVARSRQALLDTIIAAVTAEHDAGGMLPRLVAALAAALASTGPLVVLLDDAQWADPSSVGVLTMFCARITSPARLVLTLPIGAESSYHELIGSGAARTLPLPPLRREQVAEVVAGRCNAATPEAELVDAVHRAARGNARATVDVIDALVAAGSVRVVHGHAVLSDTESVPAVPIRHTPLLTELRRRGARHWAIATGMAMLAPLGTGAVAVLAEELGLPDTDVVAVLDTLTAERILARDAGPRSWTFRLPAVASALAACVGPARSRALAGLAAATTLAGRRTTDTAPPADPFLADLLANAGSLVDPEQALPCLLDAADTATATEATRWYRAAIELTTDPARRRRIRMAMVRTGIEAGRWTETATQITEALSTGGHPDAEVAELMVGATTAAAAGDDDELRVSRRAAPTGRRRRWPGSPHSCTSVAGTRPTARCPRTGRTGRPTACRANWAAGWPTPSTWCSAAPAPAGATVVSAPRRVRADAARHDHAMACLRGDLPPASTAKAVPHPEIAVLAHYLAGDWDEALRAARVAHVRPTGTARSPLPTTVYWRAAGICALRAEFGRARDWTELGRATGARAGHLLAIPQAYVLTGTGDQDAARDLLVGALDAAAETGVRYGIEEILAALVDTEIATGRVEDARRHCAHLAEVAGRVDTGRAEVLALLARAAVEQDPTAAATAVTLARRRAQPAELASTLLAAAKAGLRPAPPAPGVLRVVRGTRRAGWPRRGARVDARHLRKPAAPGRRRGGTHQTVDAPGRRRPEQPAGGGVAAYHGEGGGRATRPAVRRPPTVPGRADHGPVGRRRHGTDGTRGITDPCPMVKSLSGASDRPRDRVRTVRLVTVGTSSALEPRGRQPT